MGATPRKIGSGNEVEEDTESGVECRHDLHLDRRGLDLSGRGPRLFQQGTRLLIDQGTDDGRHRHRCADHGVVPKEAGAGSDSSFRLREPGFDTRLSGADERVRHGLLDEQHGKEFGQRADGGLVQNSEE